MTAPRPLGFWLKLLDQLIDRRFEETLGEQGVSRRQWQLLTVLGSSSASSSPPTRAALSAPRAAALTAAPTACSTLSPVGWPKQSFTTLKRSRSSITRLSGRLWRSASAQASSSLASK